MENPRTRDGLVFLTLLRAYVHAFDWEKDYPVREDDGQLWDRTFAELGGTPQKATLLCGELSGHSWFTASRETFLTGQGCTFRELLPEASRQALELEAGTLTPDDYWADVGEPVERPRNEALPSLLEDCDHVGLTESRATPAANVIPQCRFETPARFPRAPPITGLPAPHGGKGGPHSEYAIGNRGDGGARRGTTSRGRGGAPRLGDERHAGSPGLNLNPPYGEGSSPRMVIMVLMVGSPEAHLHMTVLSPTVVTQEVEPTRETLLSLPCLEPSSLVTLSQECDRSHQMVEIGDPISVPSNHTLLRGTDPVTAIMKITMMTPDRSAFDFLTTTLQRHASASLADAGYPSALGTFALGECARDADIRVYSALLHEALLVGMPPAVRQARMGRIALAPPPAGGTAPGGTVRKRISWKNEAAGDIAASLPSFPDTMPVQQWHLQIVLYLNAGPNERSTRLEMLLHEEQPLAILAAALLQRCQDNEIANCMLANERTRETLRNCLNQVVDTVKQVPYGVSPTEAQLAQCAQGVTYVLISFRGAVYLSCSPSGVVNRETSMILDKVRVKHNDETSTDYLFRVNAIVTGHVRIWGEQMMIHAQAAMGGLLTTVVNNASAADRTRIMALVNKFLTTVLNKQTSKLSGDQIEQLLLSLAPFVHTVPLQNALEKVGPDGSSRMMLASPEDLGFITQNIFCFVPLWRFIMDGLATETNTRPSGTVMHTNVFQMYDEGDLESNITR